MNHQKKYAYVCGTAPTDLWIGADVKIYPSIKALKKARTCWKECGIYRIDLSNMKCVVKGKLKMESDK